MNSSWNNWALVSFPFYFVCQFLTLLSMELALLLVTHSANYARLELLLVFTLLATNYSECGRDSSPNQPNRYCPEPPLSCIASDCFHEYMEPWLLEKKTALAWTSWEILAFLFYYLLKSDDLPNLFSYPLILLQTHTHTYVHMYTYTMPILIHICLHLNICTQWQKSLIVTLHNLAANFFNDICWARS